METKCCQAKQLSTSLEEAVSKAIHPPCPPPAGLESIAPILHLSLAHSQHAPTPRQHINSLQGHGTRDTQAGWDQGQSDTSPAHLCLLGGWATEAPLLILSIETLAIVLHFCCVSGVPQASCLSFGVSLGIIYKLGVTGSRGENCSFILEWSPEVPMETRARLLPSLNTCRTQGGTCSAPHQQTKAGNKDVPLPPCAEEEGRQAYDAQIAGREAALPSPSAVFTPPNYSSPQ